MDEVAVGIWIGGWKIDYPPYYILQYNWFQYFFGISSSLGNRSIWQLCTVAGSYSFGIYFIYIESIDILIPMFIGGFFMNSWQLQVR